MCGKSKAVDVRVGIHSEDRNADRFENGIPFAFGFETYLNKYISFGMDYIPIQLEHVSDPKYDIKHHVFDRTTLLKGINTSVTFLTPYFNYVRLYGAIGLYAYKKEEEVRNAGVMASNTSQKLWISIYHDTSYDVDLSLRGGLRFGNNFGGPEVSVGYFRVEVGQEEYETIEIFANIKW
jgi:hypothetical protein